MSFPLSIQNVTKSYGGGEPVLRGISFEVAAGEFIVLVGPSGCGKSTMLRSIAGLEKIDSGCIKIGDDDVSNLMPKDRDIAMVFQDYALYPHKTVYENIAFGLRIRKLPDDEINRKVRSAADRLNLTELLNRKPAALSGGQRQRVAIGRAIVRDPKAFLFDEPLSNLDAKLRGSMRQTISRLHEELKATSIYVTHDQVEAMTLADKIIVLQGGEIQQMGTPLDLYYHPVNIFVATFIGSPSMNLIEGVMEVGEGELFFVSNLGLRYRIPDLFAPILRDKTSHGQSVSWGLRPENLRFSENTMSDSGSYATKVLVAEPLGPTTSVLCALKGHEINISLPEPHRPKPGDTVQMEFVSKHLYLFDTESGLALS